jgi:hypothetical protein
MTINRAEQKPEDRLIRDLDGIKQFQHELKANPQPIGGDILRVEGVPAAYALAFTTIPAGTAITFTFQVIPYQQTLTLWNFAFDVYVDTNDVAHQFPNGASLTSAQRSLRLYNWLSWGDSSDATNMRVFKVRVENTDASDHVYYVRIRAYIPKLTGSA